MDNRKIEVGQIWEVITENFLTNSDLKTHNRQLKLRSGEKFEIRFPFAWNFRTEDNVYFSTEPEMISMNCRFFGNVNDNVRFANRALLSEILKLGLYKSAEAIKSNHGCNLIREDRPKTLILDWIRIHDYRRSDNAHNGLLNSLRDYSHDGNHLKYVEDLTESELLKIRGIGKKRLALFLSLRSL